MYFIDQCHQNGIGVIVDWVPGHFPKDGHGLAYLMAPIFTNTLIHGRTQRVGTLVFNYSRHEVRISWFECPVWFDKYHIDGYEDAVASMLYLDYCRKPGEWLPISTEAEKT